METPTTTVRKTFHLPAQLVEQLEREAAAEHRTVTGQLTRLLANRYESGKSVMPVEITA